MDNPTATHDTHTAPRRGLTIERVYTQHDVNPYDEITWESRDVVQTNWQTGDVIFEQRGVEFPDFWSVNASTIVATKYFRGKHGTEEREWSLKQLLNRIVDTYTNAGVSNGYFATTADAETFHDEMTFMLLHQVFSFNSPVWFNVGTNSPQQVSACFILAVDDTMDSILNWYKEEGLIFKGGSGAGVNLSRIRASKETLRSSGGSASGPVSFMRGADASAGTIKSGGATRRAAKMVILDVDHPDIQEFVETKALEERKIRVLKEAGFDMDLGGKDIVSVQYQNANNSVRVSDLFMNAVEKDEPFGLTSRVDGSVVETINAKELFRTISEAAWSCADPGIQYDDTINAWHTIPESGRINASNPCSEYMSIDNSSCNLASLNLMKFRTDEGGFDGDLFRKTVELVITAMDISICFADFPTEAIGQNTRDYRQLGIGYSNLGALLMSCGLAYDSKEGRALAASITALMTGVAYRRSAELAGVVGPYNGYAPNAEAHAHVMKKHAEAVDHIAASTPRDKSLTAMAAEEWENCIILGESYGWRNSQASVLAPTGCLVEGTLVTSDFGLMKMSEIGDIYGAQWQDLNMTVSTDEGPRAATKFFVNGEEHTRKIVTEGGYSIQGTTKHRVKVIDKVTGDWVWKHFSDVMHGDVIPLQLGGMVGMPREITLPILGENSPVPRPSSVVVPRVVSADLAELVGYFMGDGSLHAKGLRLCVADTDPDVIERLLHLSLSLFNVNARVSQQQGYSSVEINSVQLAEWWEAAGFAKHNPREGHVGKGWLPHIPTLIRATNDVQMYTSFVRGLFEADGTVLDGVPSFTTAYESFAGDVRTMMLVIGIPTTTRETSSGLGGEIWQVRLRNVTYAPVFAETIRFISTRKQSLIREVLSSESGNKDRIYLSDESWNRLVPIGHSRRSAVVSSLGKKGAVSRSMATLVAEKIDDAELDHALGFIYETVKANSDGGVQPTYDISVPDNVTYVANGFVSHNTISFMMDCDTTGIEPDFSLIKFKKLVGGGSMQIVNVQVPEALRHLGYTPEAIEGIEAHIVEHGHVIDAPGLRPEHYSVFSCAVGEGSISAEGHILMMAAVQPFISGAISKTVNVPETATVEDIEKVYFDSWKLGLKAVAVYRDNCKVGQPLSSGKTKAVEAPAAVAPTEREIVYVEVPTRTRLPRARYGHTVSFDVQGNEGYLITGEYEDGHLGEVFVKMSKQGSTLAGLIDAFSIAVSIGLQYGVPLETFVQKFIGTRFEPAGITDDPDIRMGQSVVDYIFRRLALDYLDADARSAFGILTAAERIESLNASHGVSAPAPSPVKAEPAKEAVAPTPVKDTATPTERPSRGAFKIEAPMCTVCGHNRGMRSSGACWACDECGTTTGCS